MEITREQNVASYFVVPLIDAATRPSYKASPTLAAGDVKIIRHTGGAWNVANPGTLPSAIAGATTQVMATLTAAELNPDDNQYPIIVQFIDQTATKEWDDQTVIIWTRPRVSNLKQINDLSVVGNLATLTLKQLDIQNSTGDALIAKSTGANGNGIAADGNGTGAGLKTLGGATGPGIKCTGGGGNTNGIEATGVTGGSGMQLNGGTTGHGLKCYGGGTSGYGIYVIAQNGNSDAMRLEGQGSGVGLHAIGGATGIGIFAQGGVTSGTGIRAESPGSTGDGIYATGVVGLNVLGKTIGIQAVGTNGWNGILCIGNGAAAGLECVGGDLGGDGIYAQSGNGAIGAGIHGEAKSTNGHGFEAEGKGTGHGLRAVSGAGATGSGIHCESLATSGSGLRVLGKGSSPGVDIDGGTTGNGMDITGVANGLKIIGGQSSSQGHGVHVIGGSTAGGGVGDYHAVYLEGTGLASHGLKGAGAGSGSGLYGLGGVNDGHGIHGASQVNGDGIRGSGGTEGEGIAGWGGTVEGFGILANAVADGDGLRCVGRATGHGIKATSGAGATGDGILAEAMSTNGNGINCIKTGTGISLKASDHGDGSWQEDGFQKNTASTNFEFEMVQLVDHITPALGAAITAQRSINGGAYGACTNAVVEVGLGTYKINLSAADLNGDIITFKFSAAACDTRTITIKTYTP